MRYLALGVLYALLISFPSFCQENIVIIQSIPVTLSPSQNIEIISYIKSPGSATHSTDTKAPQKDRSDEDDFDPNEAFDIQNNTQLNIAIRTSTQTIQAPLIIFDYYNRQKQSIHIKSVLAKDLNLDSKPDLYMNIVRKADDYTNATNMYFFIQKSKLSFQPITQHFPSQSVQFLQQNIIKVESPLSPFGNYLEDTQNKQASWWPDHYEFKQDSLLRVNDKYTIFYKTLQKNSLKKSEELLQTITAFQMNLSNLGHSQYQLNEYFQQFSNHKIIIARCKTILNTADTPTPR